MNLHYTVPCLFGLEGLVGDELRRLKMNNVAAENGRVCFTGSEADGAAANMRLRCGERVLIELGSFDADSFDMLFEGVRALPWELYIPKNGQFPVKGHSLDSKLFSIPDCQRIVKKAAATRLSERYGVEWLPEDGPLFQIQFAIMKDTARIYLDTTGAGLWKRGYRPAHGEAPIRETLAAGMVAVSRYRGREDFCDPMCGSGTIAIEAAMSARNMAPGLNREFSCMSWPLFPKALWSEAAEAARAAEFHGDYRIFASDIDPRAAEMTAENAKRAGVGDIVQVSVADATGFDRDTENGILITNPPYGERMLELRSAEALYRGFGAAMRGFPKWQQYIISSHPDFERHFGRSADKKRKLYNGMIKCELYIYKGAR